MSEVDLPNDVDTLKDIVRQRSSKLEVAEALVLSQKLELEKLRFEIATLKRMKFGRSSEQLDQQLIQMQLTLEDLESSLAQKPEAVRPAPKEPTQKPARRPLPAHLPREEIVHETACACPACGGELRRLGEDVSEMLEYVPERYQVIRHVRPNLGDLEWSGHQQHPSAAASGQQAGSTASTSPIRSSRARPMRGSANS